MTKTALKGLRFAIVDDSQFMRCLLKSILQTLGATEIITAEDGETGFREIITRRPDIVITDWAMEPMSGIELTQRLRAPLESPIPFVPIIMVSSMTEHRYIVEARDAGVTEFLAKPVTVKDLLQRIQSIVVQPRPFVLAHGFFGPDRRRQQRGHAGFERRETQPAMIPIHPRIGSADRRKAPASLPVSQIEATF